MRTTRSILAAVVCAFVPLAAVGQSNADAERPRLQALRVAVAPVVDGEVLEDPAWANAPAATGFLQTTPDEGEPATQRTEVFVVYDDETLYFGVVCYDDEPDRIIIDDSRRDASLNETDSFQVVLDTYSDRQSGFVFGTNPAGIEFDGQVSGVTSGGLSAGGSFNRNWDAAWEVKTQVSEIGWSAELAIPFRSLRFPQAKTSQTWGVNFQRNIRRRNESSFWAPLPRQFDLYWVSLAGELEGIEPPRQRNLQITPYVLTESSRERLEGAESESDTEAGFDLKYGVTPSLTLDATVNTDFAQVEADEQQINLDRFNLFFPEKRPFFLENSGLFSVGVSEEIELFFSRRIGLGPEGEAIPIEGGLRLSGKAGRNNLGLLYMRAEEVAGTAPENDFLVARYSRDLPNRSAVGAIVVSREGSGSFATETDDNRTVGLDASWGLGKGGQLQGFVAKTDTPGLEDDDHAFRVGGRWDNENWSTSLFYSEVAENFNPEVGFLARSGYRKPEGRILRRVRPQKLWGLHELRPHISYSGFWNFDDFQETGFLHVDNHWEWKSGYEFHTGVNFRREGVTEAFEIFDGVSVPAGTYDETEMQLVFFTNRGAPAGFEMRLVEGGFFGGDRTALSPTVRFRIGETFNTRLEWRHNDIDLPGGAFKTNLGRLRLSYSFTPRIFLQSLVQYNDRADEWATNLRFGWLQDANTGLFVVYNEIREIGTADPGDLGDPGVSGRNVIVKYSRLFDLFGR